MKFGEIMRKSGKGKGRWPCCRTGPQAAGWGCRGAVPSLGSKPAQTSGGPAAHRGPREAGLGLVAGQRPRASPGGEWSPLGLPSSPPSRAEQAPAPARPQRSWGPPHGGAVGLCSESRSPGRMEGPCQTPRSRSPPALGGLWVFGVSPPSPVPSHSGHGASAAQAQKAGHTQGCAPEGFRGLAEDRGSRVRQPSSRAGGTATMCSSPTVPEGGLLGRQVQRSWGRCRAPPSAQHGQQGTLALVSKET